MSLLRRAADLGILLSTQASTFLFDWKMQSVQSNDIEIPIWPRMLKVYDEEARELDPAQHMFKMKTEFTSFISDIKPSEEHNKPLARHQEADFKVPHYTSDSDLAALRSQYGIVMRELGTTRAASLHEDLPIPVSEQGEDRNVPNGSQSASANAATTCYEMAGDTTKCESLPQEPAELEDATPSVPPKFSNAAEKPTASPERHHQDRHQGNGSPTKRKIREPVELPNSVQAMETEPWDHARYFPGPSQQYATNSTHRTAYRKPVPVSERLQTLPPNSYPSALLNGQAQKHKMVGSDHDQSTNPPLARSPSLKDGRPLPWPCITDGAEGQQDLQPRHHSPGRSHARSYDHQYAREQRRSMDTYSGGLWPDVDVSFQRGLGVNQNRQDREAYKYSLANKGSRRLRPSSSDPASSIMSFRTRQNSTKPKPAGRVMAFMGFS